jgi:integrase
MRPKPLIAYNPCIGTRLLRHDVPERVFFEPAEYELFLAAMPQRWHAQTEFCLASMARPSEVGALTVGDVNRDTGAVRINKAFKYTGTGWRLGPPKTKRGVRTVNVPFETIDLLDLDCLHDALLFHTRRGTPIRSAYFYQEAFLPALRELIEVDERGNVVVDRLGGKRPSPYTLRHTGISWRLLGWVPMFVVSRDAGHDSYDTTDKPAPMRTSIPSTGTRATPQGLPRCCCIRWQRTRTASGPAVAVAHRRGCADCALEEASQSTSAGAGVGSSGRACVHRYRRGRRFATATR